MRTSATRILARALAVSAILALAGPTLLSGAAQAAGAPRPRIEEWWFSTWEIRDRAWPLSQGRGVTVAVLDSGVNARLPVMRGAVVPGTAIGGAGGDGRTDTDTAKGGHGTAMAALIAGRGQGTGMIGVAPEATVLPVVVPDGFATTHADAIRYAADHGAKVISISSGTADTVSPGNCPLPLQEAISDAVDKDVVIVAAAGNEGNAENKPQFPGACAGVLTVGAIGSRKNIWVKSQRQPYVAVAAPGAGVGSIGRRGQFMNYISGTSQAAALTSGAVALVRAKHPTMPARDVVQQVINTSIDVGPRGIDDASGAGAVYPPYALSKDVPQGAPNPPFQRLDQWRAANGKGAATSEPAPRSARPSTRSAASWVSSHIIPLAVLAGVGVTGLVVFVVAMTRRRKLAAAGTGLRGGRWSAPLNAPASWGVPPPPDPGQGERSART